MPDKPRTARRTAKTLCIAGLLIVLLIVIFQNTESVATHLLFATVTMPRALLLLVHLAIGFLLGVVFMMYRADRRRRSRRS